MTADICLTAAERIANRLVDTAIWSGDSCTWTVSTYDPSSPSSAPTPLSSKAGAALYQGTAGIGLFLAEGAKRFGDRRVQSTAAGALRFAATLGDAMRRGSVGLHAGRVGIAYACSRLAATADIDEFEALARRVVDPILGHEASETAVDVIGGAAGAIAPLLRLATLFGATQYRHSAYALAQQLVSRGHLDARGMSWPCSMPVHRNLLGYAHGASGIAHGLLEAYQAGGDTGFLHAARLAINYEDSLFDSRSHNWPDFRCREITSLVSDGRTLELEELAWKGLSTRQPGNMVAWCHGAAGIAPVRARAAELLSGSEYRETLESSTALIRRYLEVEGGNYSLCHGKFGNADCLLTIARKRGDERLLSAVEHFALEAATRFELAGCAWPSGTLGSLPDPSLLLGDSGIGHTLLRVACADVPSVLLLESEPSVVRSPVRSPSAQVCARFENAFLASTNSTCAKVSGIAGPRLGFDIEPGRELYAIRQALELFIQSLDETAAKPALIQAAEVDFAAMDLASTEADLTSDFLESIKWSGVNWNSHAFQLDPAARVIPMSSGDGEHLGEARFDRDMRVAAVRDQANAAAILVYRRGSEIVRRTLGSFAAAIATELHSAQTIESLLTALRAAIHPEVGQDELRTAIRSQLVAWRGQPFLRLRHPVDEAKARC